MTIVDDDYSTCPVCVCVCVCLSRRANLRTGASGHLTEGTSGFSGTFFTKVKGIFSITASLESAL